MTFGENISINDEQNIAEQMDGVNTQREIEQQFRVRLCE